MVVSPVTRMLLICTAGRGEPPVETRGIGGSPTRGRSWAGAGTPVVGESPVETRGIGGSTTRVRSGRKSGRPSWGESRGRNSRHRRVVNSRSPIGQSQDAVSTRPGENLTVETRGPGGSTTRGRGSARAGTPGVGGIPSRNSRHRRVEDTRSLRGGSRDARRPGIVHLASGNSRPSTRPRYMHACFNFQHGKALSPVPARR